jgi:hypothetical protein
MWRRTHPFLPSFLLSASYFKKPKNSRSDDAASLDTEKNIKSKSYAKESVFRSYFSAWKSIFRGMLTQSLRNPACAEKIEAKTLARFVTRVEGSFFKGG